jgi:hypothetical protein
MMDDNEQEIEIRLAEGRKMGWVRAAVVGWWRYIETIDPHGAGMMMWNNRQKRAGVFPIRLLLGLFALTPDMLNQWKPANEATLAAVTGIAQEHYKALLLKLRAYSMSGRSR